MYMITTCYQSLCFSVLFYALGVFSENIKKPEEPVVVEEKKEAERIRRTKTVEENEKKEEK